MFLFLYSILYLYPVGDCSLTNTLSVTLVRLGLAFFALLGFLFSVFQSSRNIEFTLDGLRKSVKDLNLDSDSSVVKFGSNWNKVFIECICNDPSVNKFLLSIMNGGLGSIFFSILLRSLIVCQAFFYIPLFYSCLRYQLVSIYLEIISFLHCNSSNGN